MARTTVYITESLKKRMAYEKKTNWSQVACQAFEVKLGELATEREKKTIRDVTERLRASKLEDSSKSFKNGLKEGEHWAEHTASARDLECLSRYREDERETSEPFWVKAHVEENDPDFRKGFIFGALAVWRQVEDAVREG